MGNETLSHHTFLILLCCSVAYSQRNSISIHTIDFANFTYPDTSGLTLDSQRTFRLHNGTFHETKKAVGMYFGHVFYAGDRQYGGLRQVYADHNDLIVELYGKGKIIGRDLFADDGTSAQTPIPYIITRARYRWRGVHFRRVGRPEEFTDPDPKKYRIPLFALNTTAQDHL